MSQSPGLRFVDSSDRSLLVLFGGEISLQAHRAVLRATHLLLHMPGATNVHPAYASILVDFDPLRISHREMERAISEIYRLEPDVSPPEPRTVEIPVCYGGEYGPDLDDVAQLTGLTPAQVIEIHSGGDYLVYFLGFSPGFPYLGRLPQSIATPRRRTPRRRVPAGSVAIGGQQTGIYPMASPGGWRIIGRTPLRLFLPEQDPPALLQMGDHVKFVPVSRGEL